MGATRIVAPIPTRIAPCCCRQKRTSLAQIALLRGRGRSAALLPSASGKTRTACSVAGMSAAGRADENDAQRATLLGPDASAADAHASDHGVTERNRKQTYAFDLLTSENAIAAGRNANEQMQTDDAQKVSACILALDAARSMQCPAIHRLQTLVSPDGILASRKKTMPRRLHEVGRSMACGTAVCSHRCSA